MPITINGSTGIAGVDGSAATPAIQGTDTNTGVTFPAADTVAVSTGGTERMRIDSSGNVGIGTSSPQQRLHVGSSASTTILKITNSTTGSGNADGLDLIVDGTDAYFWNRENGPILFGTNNSEQARINQFGELLIGQTSNIVAGAGHRVAIKYGGGGNQYGMGFLPVLDNTRVLTFSNASSTLVGSITTSTTATAYNTSSDYRLKENIQPMQNALAKVALLNPVTYTWKADGSEGQGFIAHELQAVVPDAVSGEKDAVDDEGNPRYQGVDTSFLVATLTKAIQELKAELDDAKARIAALEAK